MGLGYHDGVKATITPDASVSYQIADTAVKTPVLVITSDAWGSPSVVFEGQGVQDILPGIENYTPEMERQLVQDNTEVKQFWSNLGILETADGDFYRYAENGGCKYVCDLLHTYTIDWSVEPEMEDEGVRAVIANAFFAITGGRFEFPSDANLGNGQTDSVRKIVEEALTVADRRAK
jgi:hypothetical protein